MGWYTLGARLTWPVASGWNTVTSLACDRSTMPGAAPSGVPGVSTRMAMRGRKCVPPLAKVA